MCNSPSVKSNGHYSGRKGGMGSKSQAIIQEVPRFVPVVELREIVKEVPEIEIEYVEKRIDVPHVQYVDKYEEKEFIQEVEKRVPKIEILNVPVEKIKYVGVKTEKIVEKVVQVVSQTDKVFVAAPAVKDIPFVVPHFKDTEVPLVISQTIVPEIEETGEEVVVDVCKYVPELVPVDIYVPRPISVPVQKSASKTEDKRSAIVLSHEVMQKLMLDMNPHLQELEKFNAYQNNIFQETIRISNSRAKECGLSLLPPLSSPLFTMQQQHEFWEKYGTSSEAVRETHRLYETITKNSFPNVSSQELLKNFDFSKYTNVREVTETEKHQQYCNTHETRESVKQEIIITAHNQNSSIENEHK